MFELALVNKYQKCAPLTNGFDHLLDEAYQYIVATSSLI